MERNENLKREETKATVIKLLTVRGIAPRSHTGSIGPATRDEVPILYLNG